MSEKSRAADNEVACPVCQGSAQLSLTDRVVECQAGQFEHRLVFLSPVKFDTLRVLGRLLT